MADLLPTQAPTSLWIRREVVLRLPVPMLRYRQRLPEYGPDAGPERIEGPGMPQDHVLHRISDF